MANFLAIVTRKVQLFFFWHSAVIAGQRLPSLGRRQLTMKNSGHCCKNIFEATIDGHHLQGKLLRWFAVAFLVIFTFEYPSD